MNKCKQCNAVVNPKWKKCLVCNAPLDGKNSPESIVTREHIEAMTLDEFAKNKLAIKVYSKVLEKEVWMVSHEEMLARLGNEPLVTYFPHELSHLITLRPMPDDLRKINTIKELFPGSRIA